MKSYFSRTDYSDEDKITLFHSWLRGNGAKYDKINWPSVFPDSGGARGAVALDNIETNEIILEIPDKLIISTPKLGELDTTGVFRSNFLHTSNEDVLLALFLMLEMIKEDKSFWYPYLAILPNPDCICRWDECDIAELQDNDFALNLSSKKDVYFEYYQSLFYGSNNDGLFSKFPDLLKEDIYTYDLFLWCYLQVCSRTFGRRLQYLAIVPLADCLNHNNLGTKYDFNVDGNNAFRLFPTGQNRYEKGQEVYNSYGRRDNKFLLSEYGFCLMDNMWDIYSLRLDFPEVDSYTKKQMLYMSGLSYINHTRLSFNSVCWHVLHYMTICHTDEDLLPNTITDNSIISLDNYLMVLDHSIEYFKEKLLLFMTTINDDRQVLSQPDISYRLKQAIIYRLTRKNLILLQIKLFNIMKDIIYQVQKNESYDSVLKQNNDFKVVFGNSEFQKWLSNLYNPIQYVRR